MFLHFPITYRIRSLSNWSRILISTIMTEVQPPSASSTVPFTCASTSFLREPEEMNPLRRSQLSSNPSYGSIGSASRTSGSTSPKLDRVPEEQPPAFISIEDAEEEVELDLEDQGYFIGKQTPSHSSDCERFLLTSVSYRLVSTFDSLVHVRSLDFPSHLAPLRRLRRRRFHPEEATAPSSPKIFPIPPPRIHHLCSYLVVFISTPPSPLLPNLLSYKQLERCRDPARLVARDRLQFPSACCPPDPRNSK